VTFDVEAGGRVFRIEVSRQAGQERITIDGRPVAVDIVPAGRSWSLLVGHRSHAISIVESGDGSLQVAVDHQPVRATVISGARAGHAARGGSAASQTHNGPRRLVAPMPGRIVRVMVRVGEQVKAQQALMVIEAMKMENELRAVVGGTVTDVRVAEGALVESGAALIVIE
jgi:biotin carboxyl carrier protein